MWKHLYESPWHNPALIIVANAALLVLALRSRSALRAFLLIFTAEILLDSTLTNDYSLVPKTILQNVTIAFVILGDARVLLLLERVRSAPTRERWTPRWASRPMIVAAALAFVVPVLQAVLLKSLPALFAQKRAIFLAYESLAFVGILAYYALRLRPALRDAEPAFAAWARSIVAFVAVQYALWASADVIILQGIDAGFALRLVPNLLYYTAFLPFVWRAAPKELQ
jgi:hypothetical protein